MTPSALTQPSQCPWQIKSWPPTGDRTVAASGALSLDGNGAGHTADMGLPDGHYKLLWNFLGEKGSAKQKVFWVACGAPTPPPTHHPKPTPSRRPQALTVGIRQAIAICAAHHTGDAHGQPRWPRRRVLLLARPARRPADHPPLALIAVVGAGLLGTGGAAIERRGVGTACAPADSWPRAGSTPTSRRAAGQALPVSALATPWNE